MMAALLALECRLAKNFFGLRALSGQWCGAAGRPMAVSARAEDETFWREFAPFVGLAGADPLTGGARKIQTKRLSMADCLTVAFSNFQVTDFYSVGCRFESCWDRHHLCP